MYKTIYKILLITIIASSINIAQVKVNISDAFKKTALSHMEAGRYGEAIDQLNKYITSLPQDPEGYYLRAQCFEKRSQYEPARLDYRRAIGLQNSDLAKKNKYERDLQNMLNVWYALLNKKIEGHLREIAINPNIPFNYLEIGKAYKLMEEWANSEEWYDKYLERDDNASADEIIRYTEVLAKTGSIAKGERILKKYTDRFPQDWRLWSRYGYFTLWLGKYQIAKKAFETALSFKPFFKEAQDGLDLVNKQGYLSVNVGKDYAKEYPIDRYYRILKRNSKDYETRYKLIDELIKAKRIEEAYDQLKILSISKSDEKRFQDKWNYVTAYRDSLYRNRIEEAKAILQKNEFDKEALKTVSNYYEYLQNYDSAMVMLDKYFAKYPDEKDKELRFRYAKISAWSREFDKALDIVDGLLIDEPNNLDYQLFRAQVSVWINRDLDIAEKFLDNVLKKRPNDLQAIISKASLLLIKQNFEEAQALADEAKKIDASNDDVIKLQSNIDWQKLRAEEEKLYAILELGRQRVVDGDCPGAIQFYEEYISKAEPNALIQKEFGDVLFCAKDYERALNIYNQLLDFNPDYQIQMQRAKLYYAMGDSLAAVKEFKDLVKKDSSDFEARLYLADSYAKIAENDSARTIYNDLLENWQLDSTQVKMVEQRKKWLPVTGIAAIIETFPNYVGFSPSLSYYADNLSFRLLTGGARLDFGINSYLSAGVSFYRSLLKANPASLNQDFIDTIPNFRADQRFTTLKLHIFLRLSRIANLGFGFGKSNSLTHLNRDEQDAFFKIERRDTFAVTLQYQNSDAALILYSPYLLSIRQMARIYKIEGYYRNREGLKFAGMFQYIGVDDSNEGNNFYFRIGRYFYKDLIIGYEYAYDNFKWKSPYYYSPRNFESHSLWIDNELDRKDNLRITLGGKIGIIPQSSLIILAGYFEGEYSPFRNLLITGRVGIGSTSRDNSSYRYFSGQLSAYWTIF